MALSVGIEKLALLTVTIPDNCTDSKEFQKRWRKFYRRMRATFPSGIWAREPQRRGAWHAHSTVPLREDVRTGFDFAAYHAAKECWKAGDIQGMRAYTKLYSKSAHPLLRKLWPVLRKEARRCGFGRVELVPVEDGSKLAHYLSDYLAKGMRERDESEKGVRLWGIWGKDRWATTRFAWHGPSGILRRRKINQLERLLHVQYDDLRIYFGRRWSFHLNTLLDFLMLDAEQYPTMDLYVRDLVRWRSDRYRLASWQFVIDQARALSPRFSRMYDGLPKAWLVRNLGNSC
jgi:hypothetical protein